MSFNVNDKIAVIGAGNWGTAIAKTLSEKWDKVWLWAYEEDVQKQINTIHENKMYFQGIILPHRLRASNDLEEVVKNAKLVVSVTPSHVVREVMSKAKPYIDENAIVTTASKGIENDTLLLMSEVLSEILPSHISKRIVALSGPSFAREVAQHFPTTVVAASEDTESCETVQSVFSSPYFRVYTSKDVIGVEMGGALKNIIAIAAGASDGLGYAHNTRAALITRGLAEISRMAIKKGSDPLTLSGLAGMGDLVLTCTGDLSRNRTVGLKLGKGMKLKDILSEMTMVAEGVKTTKSTYDLAKKINVEMPLVEAVYNILYNDLEAKEAVIGLMTRTLKPERY